MNNYELLTINLGLGAIVLLSYIYLKYAMDEGITVDQLWGNITGNKRMLYWISISLAACCYSYIIYYTTKNKDKSDLLYYGTFLMLIGASLWAPLLYANLVNNYSNIFTILSLCLTSVGAILLTIYLYNKGNLISKIAISYYLFHVLIMDNIIWSIMFTKNS